MPASAAASSAIRRRLFEPNRGRERDARLARRPAPDRRARDADRIDAEREVRSAARRAEPARALGRFVALPRLWSSCSPAVGLATSLDRAARAERASPRRGSDRSRCARPAKLEVERGAVAPAPGVSDLGAEEARSAGRRKPRTGPSPRPRGLRPGLAADAQSASTPSVVALIGYALPAGGEDDRYVRATLVEALLEQRPCLRLRQPAHVDAGDRDTVGDPRAGRARECEGRSSADENGDERQRNQRPSARVRPR